MMTHTQIAYISCVCVSESFVAVGPGMRQKMARFMSSESTMVETKRRKLESEGWQAYLAGSK